MPSSICMFYEASGVLDGVKAPFWKQFSWVRVIGFNDCVKTLTSYFKIDNMISFKIDFKTGRKYFENELKNIWKWCFLHNARDDSLRRYTRDIQGMKVHLVTMICLTMWRETRIDTRRDCPRHLSCVRRPLLVLPETVEQAFCCRLVSHAESCNEYYYTVRNLYYLYFVRLSGICESIIVIFLLS